MKKEKVSVVRVCDYSDTSDAIASAVNMAGGFDGMAGSHEEILIKPNLQRVNNLHPGINTSKEVIRSVVKLTKKSCENVTICEADATSGTAEKAFAGGWYALAEESGAGIFNASKDRKTTVRVPRPLHFKEFEISERVHKGFRISVPVMKVAREIGVSLSMKNMFGLLPKRMKARYHIWPGIPKTVIDANQVMLPHFVIVDGTIGLEGKGGPLSGKPVHMGLILAGRDPVAVDTVTSMIMGFGPGELPYLQAASEAGIGVYDINSIEVMGNSIEEVRVPFERAGGMKGKI
jgi:uncharacterized protein (DUF362 family)